MRIRRIRDRLVTASLIMIIPFVLWTAYILVFRMQAVLSQSMTEQQLAADRIAGECSSYILNTVDIGKTIGFAISDNRMSPAEASAYMAHVSKTSPGVMGMAASNPQGIVVSSSVPKLVGFDALSFPSANRLQGCADWGVTGILQTKVAKDPIFMIDTRIRDAKGRMCATVICMVDEQAARKKMKHALHGLDTVVLTDSSGVVAMISGDNHHILNNSNLSHMPFIKSALSGNPSLISKVRMPDGTIMIGATKPVNGLGWTATVLTPREEVVGPINRQAWFIGLAVLLISGLIIRFAIYLGNTIADPILDLADTTHDFGRGDMNARSSVRTGDELEFLGSTFNSMADAFGERTSQMHETIQTKHTQAERSETLYNMAQGLIVTLSIQERLELIAQALASICGVKRCLIFLKKGTHFVGTAGYGLLYPEGVQNEILDWPENLRDELAVFGEPLEVYDAQSRDFISREKLDRYNIKGYLAMPLIRMNHLVGVAILDTPGEHPHFDQSAIDIARGLGSLAAISIENAEAYNKWHNIAQALQKGLLPCLPEKMGAFSFASKYYPAMETAELGGDFYDFIQLPDGRVGIVIADVSGKGLEAAVFTAMGKYSLRAFVSENDNPGHALTRTNDALSRNGEWGFVTMFYGLLDTHTGHLSYASAGHLPSILVRSNGDTIPLPCIDRQPPVGIFSDITYETQEIELGSGDVLVCYTDGVIEARREKDMFQIERLMSLVAEQRHNTPSEIAESIHNAVADFSYGRRQDDIALLVLKRDDPL